jgi:hypothetical protein
MRGGVRAHLALDPIMLLAFKVVLLKLAIAATSGWLILALI